MTRTFGLPRFHRPEAAVEAVTLSCRKVQLLLQLCLSQLFRVVGSCADPACVPGVAESFSSHFNEVLNNPEEFWGLRVAGCCFSAEFGSMMITPTDSQLLQNKLYFFFSPQNPLWTGGFLSSALIQDTFLWWRLFFYPGRIYNLLFFPGGKSVHYEVTKLSSEKSDSSLLWPS